MLSVANKPVMLSVIMLNVFMLSVFILSVVAPFKQYEIIIKQLKHSSLFAHCNTV
jgi:hypothetical protein